MLRRVLLGLVIVIGVLLVAVVGVVVGDSQAFEMAGDVTNVEYPAADGTTLVGYLAQPEAASEPRPAVLMVHEWWGLNAEIAEMADILAEQGYVVLAPDTYRGRVATTVPGALALRISADKARVDSDMQAAFDYLASLPNVDATRIAVMGFCYGGGVALRHGVANAEIVATINLYGDTIDDPVDFGALLTNGRPVLGIFGAEDAQIPVSEANAFDAALDAAGIPNEVTIYPGVGHAFVNPHTIDEGAARDAWAQITAFLADNLSG